VRLIGLVGFEPTASSSRTRKGLLFGFVSFRLVSFGYVVCTSVKREFSQARGIRFRSVTLCLVGFAGATPGATLRPQRFYEILHIFAAKEPFSNGGAVIYQAAPTQIANGSRADAQILGRLFNCHWSSPPIIAQLLHSPAIKPGAARLVNSEGPP
jgi:hypothetical protein